VKGVSFLASAEQEKASVLQRTQLSEFDPEVRDLDGDGDLDFVSTRGNSGALAGVLWLEQVRTDAPALGFTEARDADSRQMPLPPADWRGNYRQSRTYEPAANAE
jgi:hypothetical protein